jgi:hypothetical protein
MHWRWLAAVAAFVVGLFVILLFLGVMNSVLASASPVGLILTVAAVGLALVVLVVLMLWSRETKISA